MSDFSQSRLDSALVIDVIDVKPGATLGDYASDAGLSPALRELLDEAQTLTPALQGRTVWMINSTAHGGGVAEMLPRQVALLRQLGVDVRWAVIRPGEPRFFDLTKRLHNLIHGVGTAELSADDVALYASVSEALAGALRPRLGPRDVLVTHDPQPAGVGAVLKQELGLPAVWRCHIGLAERTPETRAAWTMLRPHVAAYDAAVFTAPEYIPSFLADRVSLITPAIDPWSHKNRALSPHKLAGILCNGGLMPDYQPVVTRPWASQARRLGADGHFQSGIGSGDIGLMFRPTILQVSRWDHLKGFAPLLRGFVELKRRGAPNGKERNHRRFKLVRLILAGPDASSVADDPQAEQVLRELCQVHASLDAQLQDDIAILSLPMKSPKQNALMVNALQRCASVVVQNSLQEGFGLTVTEAMWKGVAVLGSNAVGLAHQIQDGINGRRLHDPEDPTELAEVLGEMLASARARDRWGARARRHVYDQHLIFGQLRRWLRTLNGAVLASERTARRPGSA